MLIGFGFAFLTAILEGSKDIFFSSEEARRAPHVLKALVLTTLSIPVVAAVVVVKGLPEIKPEFWVYVVTHAALMAIATVLYMRALALGPVSQTQPILALTTVLLVLTNPLMTDEAVTPAGWAGVIAVGVGIYATQHPGTDPVTGEAAPFWAPFLEMVRQEGVRSKLGVAFIFAVTANLDRLALDAADGPTYLLVDLTLTASLLAAATALSNRSKRKRGEGACSLLDAKIWRSMAPGGIVNSLTILSHVAALAYTTVPYVIAIKRLSIVLVSFWGYFKRKERAPHWYRLLGTILVVLGIGTILILG